MGKKLAAILLATGIAMFGSLELSAIGESPKIAQAENPKKEIISSYIHEFTKEYLEGLSKASSSVKESIEKKGYEPVYQTYSGIMLDSLNYAIEKKIASKEDNEKYEGIARKFLEKLEKNSNDVPIDYSHKDVVSAYTNWVSIRVELYRELLNSKQEAGDYNELVRKVIGVKRYKEYHKKQIDNVNEVHDAFISTRKGVKGWFAEGSINKSRKFVLGFYEKKNKEIMYGGV